MRTVEDLRLEAYARTRDDGEAARMLSISRNAFRAWREARGLPPKRRPGRPRLDETYLEETGND